MAATAAATVGAATVVVAMVAVTVAAQTEEAVVVVAVVVPRARLSARVSASVNGIRCRCQRNHGRWSWLTR